MEIPIRIPDDVVFVTITETTTVDEVTKTVAEENDFVAAMFDLVYEGTVLDLDKRLFDFGIDSHSELELVPSLSAIAKEKLKQRGIPPTPRSLLTAITQSDEELIKLVLQSGVDINNKANGTSPLIEAVSKGDEQIVNLLLRLGSDPNYSADLVFPLHTAVEQDRLSIVKILLKAGSLPNEKDLLGNTAVFTAQSTAVLNLLVEFGARLDAVNNSGETPLHIGIYYDRSVLTDFILQHGSIPEGSDDDGGSVLHYASSSELVKKLLARGADPTLQNWQGDSPLHQSIVHSGEDLAITKLLISEGRSINIQNCDGQTPLHLICALRQCV